MKCYEGTILSVDSNDGVYRYLVEHKGRILFIGNELPDSLSNMQVHSLGNRVLAPAFVDTHQHFASLSTFNAGLNVMEAESNEQIARMIGEYASKTNDQTIIAFGASPHSVKEERLINHGEIDAVCPGKEVMVVKYDGHACIVSTPLLKKLDKKLSKFRGYHPNHQKQPLRHLRGLFFTTWTTFGQHPGQLSANLISKRFSDFKY